MDDTAPTTLNVIDLMTTIVAAFVSNNSLPAAELPTLLINVHAAINALANGSGAASTATAGSEVERATPAQIRKSITPEALISFLDGKPYKTLKRHLSSRGLDFDTYRTQYGLPSHYPTVAPSYSATRSALAESRGLGQGGARAASGVMPSGTTVADKPKRRRATKKAGQ